MHFSGFRPHLLNVKRKRKKKKTLQGKLIDIREVRKLLEKNTKLQPLYN